MRRKVDEMELTRTTQITDVLEDQFFLPPLAPVPALHYNSVVLGKFAPGAPEGKEQEQEQKRPSPALNGEESEKDDEEEGEVDEEEGESGSKEPERERIEDDMSVNELAELWDAIERCGFVLTTPS